MRKSTVHLWIKTSRSVTRTATLEFMKTHQQNAEFRIRAAAAAAAEGGG